MASTLTKGEYQHRPSSAGPEKTFMGHPRGLVNLFMTEMWERYSFYGMRALLVLYLVAPASQGGLAMNAAMATAIYSLYNAMVYLLALPGGWFADRAWGARKTVAIGGTVIMIGHFLLAVPARVSFFVGLVCIAVGSGLLKANISTMVGHLYEDKDDPRRDGGFTIFYMGINLGAFIAPLTIGTIGQSVSWHLGFAMAGVGMALGLGFFALGSRHMSERSDVVPTPLSRAERTAVVRKPLTWLAVAAVAYGCVGLSGHFTLSWAMLPLTVLCIVLPSWYLLRMKRDKSLGPADRARMSAYVWFFAAAALFWGIYDQTGSTLNLFAQDSTSRTFFGMGFPASWFQACNPLYIMALAPVFAWGWVALSRRAKEPGTPAKFAVGLVLIGLSFAVMMVAQGIAVDGVKVSPMWLVMVYLIQTVGELTLSPVGLSLTTKLAPEKYSSQMMGVWFLAVTVGDSVVALLQQFGVSTDAPSWFASQGALALLGGIAIFVYRNKVKALMGGVR
ncbi:peptide MFS transporter [Streptomyces sp. NPDC056401]|uniref:peptide MFS transporter n=1 Tax=Streptomyces sp. NPDC056401 TaxID=3345809 RepID=UPI0035E2DE13